METNHTTVHGGFGSICFNNKKPVGNLPKSPFFLNFSIYLIKKNIAREKYYRTAGKTR
jgi:hypothetical protein